MTTQLTNTQTRPSRTHRIRHRSQTLLLACGIVLEGGFLSQAGAHPAKHSARPCFRKAVPSRSRAGQNKPTATGKAAERAEIHASYSWLNETDHPELRTFATIFGVQVPEVHALFPDPQMALILNPSLGGGEVYHEAPRTPWTGHKDSEQYRQDSDDRVLKLKGDWTRYLATYRFIAEQLGAENTPYPTAPSLQWEMQLAYGSGQGASLGEAAYSSEAPGGVYLPSSPLVQRGFYTSVVMQRSQVSSWAGDKMAQEFMSPLHCMDTFQPDTKFARAWKQGDDAAHVYEARIASGSTSKQRGEYARQAEKAYHNTYLKAYHAE